MSDFVPFLFFTTGNILAETLKLRFGICLDVNRVPVMAGLHSTDKVTDLLLELTSVCKKHNLSKYFQVLNSGVEVDEYKESFERLECLAGRYRDLE